MDKTYKKAFQGIIDTGGWCKGIGDLCANCKLTDYCCGDKKELVLKAKEELKRSNNETKN